MPSTLSLPSSDLPSALANQLTTALAQGTLLAFISTLTHHGLRNYGCSEKQTTIVRELTCFVTLVALNGLPEDSVSLFNIGLSYFVSKIPDAVGYMSNHKSTVSLLSSFGSFAEKLGLRQEQGIGEIKELPENPIYRV